MGMSSAGQRKHASQRPMFYRWTTQPTSSNVLGVHGAWFMSKWTLYCWNVDVDESRDWSWSHGRSVALSVALKEAADRLVTSPTLGPRVKQALVTFTNNDRVSHATVDTTTTHTTTTHTTTTCTTTTIHTTTTYYYWHYYYYYYVLPTTTLTFQNMDPLRFQAGGRRRRPNLGLVCFVLMIAVFLVKDACLFSSCRFSFSLVMR